MENIQTLDARGLNCPLPILRAKKSLNGMQSGETLKVVSTDPGSVPPAIDWTQICSSCGQPNGMSLPGFKG